MRITISGKAGCGKSTVAKLLSKKLRLHHYSIGDLMRAMASEKGISLLELNKIAEKDKSIDFELDNRLKELGGTKNNFIVDGRLTAFFIPHAELKVFLETDDNVRAQRILKGKRQQEESKSFEEAISNIKKREFSEVKRYKKYYSVNYLDKRLYDLVIDTTKLTIKQVVNEIIRKLKRHKKSQ